MVSVFPSQAEGNMAKDNGIPKSTASSELEIAAGPQPKPHCGIVMPISELAGQPAAHWAEVKAIIVEAVESEGFAGNLVSQADYAGTILKRIVQRLYDDPVIVVDVSGKNPNVMFELGLRLAFDRPTVIIKDDQTGYSFDTGVMEHLEYPRDLRFSRIVKFKEDLGKKVRATYDEGKNPDYSTFLKHFGTFTKAKLETKEVSNDQYLSERLDEIGAMLRRLSIERETQSSADYRDRVRFMVRRMQDRGQIPLGLPVDIEGLALEKLTRTPGAWSTKSVERAVLEAIEAYAHPVSPATTS
jgi:hypothetical protein